MKVFIYSQQSETGNQIVDSAAFMQSNTLLRTCSAKILDFFGFFDENSNRNQTNDETVVELMQRSSERLAELKQGTSYKLVKVMRNEVTNHFYLEPARRNVEHISPKADLSIHVHKMFGNSFSPLGSELMYVARIKQFSDNSASKEELLKLHKDWVEWTTRAAGVCNQIFSDFAKTIIIDRFPSKFATRKDHWVPQAFVGTVNDVVIPIFFRLDQ